MGQGKKNCSTSFAAFVNCARNRVGMKKKKKEKKKEPEHRSKSHGYRIKLKLDFKTGVNHPYDELETSGRN